MVDAGRGALTPERIAEVQRLARELRILFVRGEPIMRETADLVAAILDGDEWPLVIDGLRVVPG